MSGIKGRLRKPADDSGRARMWRVMRRRIVFSRDDIVVPLDGVTTKNAEKFINNLVHHGIVRVDRWSGKPGVRGSFKVYRLVVECQDIDNDFLCHDIADTQLIYRSL